MARLAAAAAAPLLLALTLDGALRVSAQMLRPEGEDGMLSCTGRCQIGPASTSTETQCGCDTFCVDRDDCCLDACEVCGIACRATRAPEEPPTAAPEPEQCAGPDDTYTVMLQVQGVFENGAIPPNTSPEPTYSVCQSAQVGPGAAEGDAPLVVEPATAPPPEDYQAPAGSQISWGTVDFPWLGEWYTTQSSFCFEPRFPLPLELPCEPKCKKNGEPKETYETFVGVFWHDNFVIMPAFLTHAELVLTTVAEQVGQHQAAGGFPTTAAKKNAEGGEAITAEYRVPISLLETTNNPNQLPNTGECPGPFPDAEACPDRVSIEQHRWWPATFRQAGEKYKVDVVFKSAREDGGNEITGDGKDFWTEEEKRNAVLLYLVVTPVCPSYVDDDSGKVAIAGFAANATFVQTQLDLAEPPIPAPIG